MQKAKATECCAVAPDDGASAVWNLLLHVTLLDSRVVRLLPDFWGEMYICTPVVDGATTVRQSGMALLYESLHSASKMFGR